MTAPTTPTGDAAALAARIARDLFTSGIGKRAERLVLTSSDGRDMGGWCEKAVTDRIAEQLRATPPQPDAALREAARRWADHLEREGRDLAENADDTPETGAQIRHKLGAMSEEIDAIRAALAAAPAAVGPVCDDARGDGLAINADAAPPPAGQAVTEEMVERAARVIFAKTFSGRPGVVYDEQIPQTRDAWMDIARAAIAAALERGEGGGS